MGPLDGYGITRPAVSEERLSLNTPWNDGTIHVIFEWGGEKLINKWKDGPLTYLGLQTAGFPNMFTLAGPQSGSVSSNFPPAIEAMLIWTCDLIKHLEDNQVKTCEPTLAAEREWLEEYTAGYHLTLLGSSKSWFTCYNSNLEGRDTFRPLVYFAPAAKFRPSMVAIAENGYEGFELKR